MLTPEKLHQVKELGKGGAAIEPIPDIYAHREIPELGKMTFTEQELRRFAFMDRYGNMDTAVTVEEITNYILELHEQFKRENSAEFFNEQRDILLHTIVDRFALGGIMAKSDKTGGPVDTVHNAREGVYATQQEAERYAQHPEYDSREYHSDQRYITKNRQGKDAQESGTLRDEYTGDIMARNEQRNLDHIKSAAVIHDDPGRILAELNGIDLANTEGNFAFTSEPINKSKKAMSAVEFADRLDSERESRQARIRELSGKTDPSDKERKELNKLEKLDAVDTAELRRRGKAAEKSYDRKVSAAYYTSSKFIKSAVTTSVGEGAKMGFRQMLSNFIRELINAVFDEIRDCCSRVKKLGEKWYKGLGERLKRIGIRIAGKWKKILESGKDGFISGFCSNVVTVIINIFVTTAKNIVRLIREGFFSLVRAIKLLLNPPPEMTKNQLFHETGKLIISGAVITFGILAEETIDKFPPMVVIKRIPLVGELLTDVILGLLTALVTSLALWAWDKLDLFGAKKEAQHKFVMETLERDLRENENKYNEWLESIRYENPGRYEYLKAELT